MAPLILVTGAAGQIGSELVPALRAKYGTENVVAGILPGTPSPDLGAGPEERFDVTHKGEVAGVLRRRGIEVVYHLAAILSSAGEGNPALAWSVNLDGLKNVLDCAAEQKLSRVFWPSSVAVFGPGSPRRRTPQGARLTPTSIYGVTKVTGELLCNYFSVRHGLDVRSVRYPGLVSSKTRPGGGTTDYAVEMFDAAIRGDAYDCFLEEGAVLPMMYMPDAIAAALKLMDAEPSRVKLHTGYNLSAMSFSPGQLAAEIRKHVRGFRCTYSPDSRQLIAESWPESIDDGPARRDWGWEPTYGLPRMVSDMLRAMRGRTAQK